MVEQRFHGRILEYSEFPEGRMEYSGFCRAGSWKFRRSRPIELPSLCRQLFKE
jgi:hypothetical protein